jgi:hypothetical protein
MWLVVVVDFDVAFGAVLHKCMYSSSAENTNIYGVQQPCNNKVVLFSY